MSVSLVIRPADKNDAAAIAAISRKTFYDTFAAHNTPENMEQFMNETFTEAALMEEVGAKGNIFLVAVAEGEMVGYARMREAENPPELGHVAAIELARIYSLQAMIGKGVGKALMQRCIEVARKMRRQVLWLGVWEHNRRAIDFYTSWGFEQFGVHDFVLGSDVQKDWMMKLTL
jgi:ribosomal protein S18 acetylase RimI-like enzyme